MNPAETPVTDTRTSDARADTPAPYRAERFTDRYAPGAAAGAVRTLGATLRLSVVGVQSMLPLWAAARPLIYVVWHGRNDGSRRVSRRLRQRRRDENAGKQADGR